MRKCLDSHAGFTRIASYYGVGGTGLGRPDGTDGGASGDARWAVYRKTVGTDTYDLMIAANVQGGNSTVTDPSGSYYIATNDYGLGFAVAWHSSSQAWNGTTASNGNDSFVTPWKSGAIILPRSNGLWGIHSSSRNNLSPLYYANFSNQQYLRNSGTLNFIADHDNFLFFGDGGTVADEPNNAVYSLFGGVFYITPASSSFNLPYLMLAKLSDGEKSPIQRGYAFTNKSTNNSTAAGLWISKPVSSSITYNSNSFGYGLDWDVAATDVSMSLFEAHPTTGTGSYTLEHPILVFGAVPFMYMGYLDFLRVVSPKYKSGDRIGSGSRAVLGWGSNVTKESSFTSCSIPWSSSFGKVTPVSGTFYSSGNVFLLETTHSYTHMTQSTLYDIILSSGSTNIFYRARSGANYVYDVNNPPGGSDIVLIGKFRQ
jgi:hypothetical protein